MRTYLFLRALLFALLSPWAEKNPVSVASVDAPYVLSLSRCIVTAFSYGMYQQMKVAAIAGWPEATLCIALVYAIPILNALQQSKAADVLDFGKVLLSRFGVGDVRTVGSLMQREPSKHDDERGAHTEREDVG